MKPIAVFNQQTNKPTNQQTNKPTNQQTNKQTSKQASKQLIQYSIKYTIPMLHCTACMIQHGMVWHNTAPHSYNTYTYFSQGCLLASTPKFLQNLASSGCFSRCSLTKGWYCF